ncbi:SusC/RagA family TonB-linked outer membrane protein [Dysgonomonas sp. GY75]|uniref:SusC/RagA family TonB-linked outer membrane protein n=1 Tax=Dysgonomonas sp. GY75 TaxID=2780419 RepID=UPI001F5521B1|nr:TonB-dependent receptor [Dysgonomonas sp. GY75]
MKLSVFLFFVSVFSLYARDNYSQQLLPPMEMKNATLKQIFSEIEKKSDYVFLVTEDANPELTKKISFKSGSKAVSEVMDVILSSTELAYKVVGRQIAVYRNSEEKIPSITQAVVQQKKTITGVVTDAVTGQPVIGASVWIKDSTTGTFTDADGKFSIQTGEAQGVLVFSFLGYLAQEIPIGNKIVIDVQLREGEDTSLDEIVVVGYGTQRKSSITGAISSVNVQSMKDITTPSVANMLQGKVAGVAVSPVSGQPGAGVTVRVRGTGSIRGMQDPLWVIDGVVGDAVADLNPNDVEAISILKDGSATALYGSRGANGVILVTTKRGAQGVSQFDASAKLGISTLQKGNMRMMNGAEYYDYLTTAYENAGILEQQHWLQPYLREQNTDWWDLATQNALTQNYNLGYRYGNEKIRSYISGDYYNEEGAIKGYKYDRFTLRVNTDYIVNKRLTLKAKLATSYRETDNQEHSLSYTSYSPWDSPWDSHGNLKDGSQGLPTPDMAPDADPRDYWYSDGGTNYLYDRHLNWSKGRHNAMDLGLGFDFKIFDFLTYESNNKFGFNNSYTNSYTDPNSRGGAAKKGTVTSDNSNKRVIYTSQILRFLKTFADKHEINAFLGYDYDEVRNWNTEGEASNIFPGTEVLSGGAANPVAKGGKSEEKNAAYFFNGNYAYDGKYLFQISTRSDGSSRFGANKRWASFWSVGGGWNMHQEEFIKQLAFVDELKPRISYGITGNLPSGAYEWTTKLSTDAEYGSEVAFMSNYAGNKNLSWEQTGSLDFGLDIRLFNRVNIVFDAYSKKVKNLIYLRHLTAVTGYNRQTANDGKLENNGYEITITPEIIKTRDFFWDVSFNIGYNKNKITYLPDGDELAQQAVAVGYPYRNWYMREWAGVDAMTGSPLWFIVDEETGQKTTTDDYNAATRVLLNASPSPKYNGGISTSFVWKGLSLNASFTFSAGAKIYNGKRAGALDRDAERPSQPAMKLADGWSRWEKPGDIATHPKLIAGGNNNAASESTRYLENGDYFKMKTISLAYSLPKRWLTSLGIRDLSISIGGENLFTITKFSGDDPEILLSSRYNGTTSPSSGQLYPTTRRFTMGLNLKF